MPDVRDPADSELQAFQSAGCVLLRWTPVGEIVSLNSEGRALFGAVSQAAQVLGATSLAEILGSLRQSRAATSETTLQAGDGTRCLLWSHRPIGDASATGLAEIVSVAMDVTRYHQMARSLEASEKTLTEIANHLEQCVWIKDPSTAISGRMTYASPAFERIFGIPPEQLHGRPDALFDLVHPEDLPRFRATNSTQFEREYDIEYRLIRPDGSLRWLWSRAMPVRDNVGRVVRLVGITEDITARKDNETRIRQLNAELEQMYRSEQELSRTDALTGLSNRLRYTEEGDRLWKNT